MSRSIGSLLPLNLQSNARNKAPLCSWDDMVYIGVSVCVYMDTTRAIPPYSFEVLFGEQQCGERLGTKALFFDHSNSTV